MLFYFTIIALAIWGLSYTPIIETFKSITSSGADLEREIDIFKKNQEKLSKGESIQKLYKEIEDQFPAAQKGQKPDHAFSEDIDRLCKSLGFLYPTIDPPTRENIEDVEEYQFITLNVRTSGDLAAVSKLLKGFADKKLIIKEINLKSAIDNNTVHTMVKVARIAKAEQDDEAAKKKRRLKK